MNHELTHDATMQEIKWRLESGERPSAVVRHITECRFELIAWVEKLPFKVKPRIERAVIRAIKKRAAAIERRKKADAEKFDRLYAWVDSQITKCGAWIHALASDGKALFGRAYCTKGRVLDAVRRNPDLTVREQPYGDGVNDTAPAAFRGKPVPHEVHEDQPLPI